jgi:hypothetical protein
MMTELRLARPLLAGVCCRPWQATLFALACTVALCGAPGAGSAADSDLQLASFRADLTPPLGENACIGFMAKVSSVEHPLELRGVVLRKGGGTSAEVYVVAALDYNGLCNSSYDLFRQRMADAAETTPDRVALQSLHQHTAPVVDVDGARLLYAHEPKHWQAHAAFAEEMADRAAAAIREAASNRQPVTRIVASKAKVEKVASNRRLVQPDGSVVFRGSGSRDPQMHDAPEGLIDPWLRTLSFFHGERPLVQIHYYATHPQSFYGDERISWDVPGIARQRLQDETGVFQIYFTGCGGNLAMGKYNDLSRAARDALSERLYSAMKAAADPKSNVTSRSDAQLVYEVRLDQLRDQDVAWDVVPVKFSPREDGEFKKDRARDLMRPEQPFSTRLKSAMAAAWFDRLRAGHQVGISRLRIGAVQIVHLPGEPFVEFQLFAQQATPESFVCVAGYGECGVWYFGPDSIFSDRGGYDQTWSFTEPCQEAIEAAMTTLLKQRTKANAQ